jgi:DNA polymerase-4
VTRSITLPKPLSTTRTLAKVATQLADNALADQPGEREITLLGLSVSHLHPEDSLQLELPIAPHDPRADLLPRSNVEAARWGVDRSLDAVRKRFGQGAIGYANVVFSGVHRVPEDFRELAERSPSR